jgi:hypothetical protein
MGVKLGVARKVERVLMMVYNIRIYWFFGLYTTSGII